MFRSRRSEKMLEDKLKVVLAEEYGYKGGDVVLACNCDSSEEANRKAFLSGLGSKWFLPDCCEEAKDPEGVDLFKESDVAVCVDGKNFLSVPEISEALLR